MYLVLLLLNMITSGTFNNAVKGIGFHQVSLAHTYKLVFEHGPIAPDNYFQQGILINGQFPGPIIRVKPYEILTVNVVNKLNHQMALHFHGIHQVGTVSSDGVPMVTQYSIPSNGTYRYSMEVGGQSGTFIYHSHNDLDQNWAMGALIIEENPTIFPKNSKYLYDYEETFILSQCWHVPVDVITAGILGTPFEDVPETDSILINGRSYGNWDENDDGDISLNSDGYQVITVKHNAIYRFRVIALGLDSMLTFSIANHSHLSVIEMDGILVEPVDTDHLELNSAQRYSVLVKMNQPIGNYWIQSEMIPGPGPGNGRAILHYLGAPYPGMMRTQIFENKTLEVELTEWIQDKLYPSPTIHQSTWYAVPSSVDKEIVITSHQVNVNGSTKFDINGAMFVDYDPPMLHQIRHGVNFSNKEPQVYELILGETVQIVFVNTFSDDGECEQHPWHIHGHTFHVVGEGPDGYDPVVAKPIIEANIAKNKNQFRDVVTLFPNTTSWGNTTGTSCGWIAVRFEVNNPGVWIVHCHLTAHMLMGKMFILYEHTEQDPRLAHACATKKT